MRQLIYAGSRVRMMVCDPNRPENMGMDVYLKRLAVYHVANKTGASP